MQRLTSNPVQQLRRILHEDNGFRVLYDWELLKRPNEVNWRKKIMRETPPQPTSLESAESSIGRALASGLERAEIIAPSLRVPDAAVVEVLWPSGDLAENRNEDA